MMHYCIMLLLCHICTAELKSVSGPILMDKANKTAEASEHTNFKATDGWFSRWKK